MKIFDKRIMNLIPYVNENFFELKSDEKGLYYTFNFHYVLNNNSDKKLEEIINIPQEYSPYISLSTYNTIDNSSIIEDFPELSQQYNLPKTGSTIIDFQAKGYFIFFNKEDINFSIVEILEKIVNFNNFLHGKEIEQIDKDNIKNISVIDTILFNLYLKTKYINFKIDLDTEYDFSYIVSITIDKENKIFNIDKIEEINEEEINDNKISIDEEDNEITISAWEDSDNSLEKIIIKLNDFLEDKLIKKD